MGDRHCARHPQKCEVDWVFDPGDRVIDRYRHLSDPPVGGVGRWDTAPARGTFLGKAEHLTGARFPTPTTASTGSWVASLPNPKNTEVSG